MEKSTLKKLKKTRKKYGLKNIDEVIKCFYKMLTKLDLHQEFKEITLTKS